jgi:hypothetical protein
MLSRKRTDWQQRVAQSFRLAEFGGLGMSFNVCRGTLGGLAIFPGPAARLAMPFVGGCDHSNAARYLQAGTGALGRAQ